MAKYPRRLLSSIAVRLLAFNVLLLFVPLVGLLSFDAYERTLLRDQEESMVQQGRLLAAALGGAGDLDAERARGILQRLQQRTTSRLRVLDDQALPLADSSRLGPRLEPGDASDVVEEKDGRLLYTLGALPFRLLQRLRVPSSPPVIRDFYSPNQPFRGSEVRAALDGSYVRSPESVGRRCFSTVLSRFAVRAGSSASRWCLNQPTRSSVISKA